MGLGAIPPRDDSRREQERYERDLADMKARPYAWALAPDQVPERIIQETVVFRTVERPDPGPQPAPLPDAARASQPAVVAQAPTPPPAPPPQPVPPPVASGPIPRGLSALPGVLIGPDGRPIPV